MLMKDVDSKSRSQKRLQGVNVEDPTHEKEGTMFTLKRTSLA